MNINRHDIRQDLQNAHEQAWTSLSEPGTWWSGAQRRELAVTALMAVREVEPLPPWVTVSSVSGRVPNSRAAPLMAHDAIYRIARHASTLTSDWYARVCQQIDPLAYIELCGIACIVATISSFRRALGLEFPELAKAKSGEPSRQTPNNVVSAELNWVPVTAPADKSAAVVQAFTAVPETNRVIWAMADAQYIPDKEMVDPHWTRGTLSRVQMELVATRVSQQRECFY